jgi:hypothetical protein
MRARPRTITFAPELNHDRRPERWSARVPPASRRPSPRYSSGRTPAVLVRAWTGRNGWAATAFIGVAALLFSGASDQGAEVPKAPVPPSPFVSVVYKYADAMLEHGRERQSGLLFSALDRTTLAPLTNLPPAPSGVRAARRVAVASGALAGSNPHHDEDLLRLLYLLSELSSKPKYREAADQELKWFLQHTLASETHLLPWGKHMAWDPAEAKPIKADGAPAGRCEFFRPWLLWDRCFDLVPVASRQFALGLWDHQIADLAAGAFERPAGFSRPSERDAMDSPRQAGFIIRTWAVAWARTSDEQFLRAIEVLLLRFEKKRRAPSGGIEAYAGAIQATLASTLSLAIDCDGAAHRVPEPLASRLRDFAAREDEVFCAQPHELKTTGGFITDPDLASGQVRGNSTPLWDAREDSYTTAQVGMMCVSRYDNTGRIGYRELVHSAAEAYLQTMPAADSDAWPATLGQAISLQLAAWRSTAQPRYLDRARALGNFAMEKFFDQGPLPRASLRTRHYETVTGADTLALALVELHLHILHITAVRCPPNTIDR